MATWITSANNGTLGTELWITDGTANGTVLLKDINPGSIGSNETNFTQLGNNKLLFRADNGTAGLELWVTDGTAAGTSLVKDTYPGYLGGNPDGLTALGNGKMVFAASGSLWVTDGTGAGTSLISNYAAGLLTAIGNGKAVFRANSNTGVSLFVTDGTAAGTSKLTPANGGNAQFFFVLGNGKVMFQSDDGTTGLELWVSDGTSAGTSRVKDINVGGIGSNPRNFAALGGGQALFQANDGSTGYEMWVTDGTAAGTSEIKDINPGVGASQANSFTALGNGSFVFSADNGAVGTELWVSDGTAAGTSLVKDIASSGSSSPHWFVSQSNGKAFFVANDGTTGNELWVTDGTAAGTSLIKDIRPGNASSHPDDFTSIGGGKWLFRANDGIAGYEMWVTDGTAGGTSLLKDINAGSGNSGVGKWTPLQAPILVTGSLTNDTGISAVDGITKDAAIGGSASANAAITVMKGSTVLGTTTADAAGKWSFAPSLVDGPHTLTVLATAGASTGSVFVSFTLDTAGSAAPGIALTADTGLSSSDTITKNPAIGGIAEANATVTVKEGATTLGTALANGSGAWTFAPGLSDGIHTLIVFATDAAGNVGGTSSSTTFTLDTVGPAAPGMVLIADTGSSATDGITSNATVGGTTEANATVTVKEGSSVLGTATADVAGKWSFTPNLSNGAHMLTAFATDISGNAGSTSSTVALTLDTVAPTIRYVSKQLAVFQAGDSDGIAGRELWVTDGTATGTSLILDIRPGSGTGDPRWMTSLGNGKAVFNAATNVFFGNGFNDAELWVTDGTAAGSSFLKDINPGALGSGPQDFVAIGNGKALFRAYSPTIGEELWTTDGTAGGTSLVKNIVTTQVGEL